MKNPKKNFITRPPIVVVMGHIDHGKSKLLDYIRNANIVDGEAGGITQHIGAYEAEIKCKDSSRETRKITFLDTPGHEAFSQMRLRGAKIADAAILVIAADEGIKPQTTEAYEAIKEAKIPFIIALNKIDKPNADPDRIKNQLSEKEIFVEGYGGNIPAINISAKTGEGVDELLDILLLMMEMETLEANPEANASGIVIESKMSPKRGISATLIIQDGIMKKGMYVVAEGAIAPVRIFEDFKKTSLEEATFSSPIKIVGFDKVPPVGAKFQTYNTKKEAEIALAKIAPTQKPKEKNGTNGKENTLYLIIKTDVTGSLEALEKEISKIPTGDIDIIILKEGVGNINEDDARMASSAKNSAIIGFNVEIGSAAKELAERFNIALFVSNIIYKISEWLEEEIEKRTKKEHSEEITGSAEILKIFSKAKNKQLIGGRVVSVKIIEGKKVRIKRDDSVLGEGKITELHHNKARVKEVSEGAEFGAMIECKTEIAKGDLIEIVNKIS